ncbi:hypothetical protein [Clostridium saccharoperbutylacetonicum]|uniref:hypothetical protein n=1 Tax=Clostridium saccharoperbutylacetonicum TaxID=36745 RepID=UPI000983DE1D|nr:hypothetical protein [Clostridium saccharoperbutylacetonicum]AQR93411.1 hypothetical protein CLSAP_07090 [Clostridium saccharoperbutylacetonicum]NSB29108.1 hypothetical protein [Clostridium saccharoperbutylacetonicum]
MKNMFEFEKDGRVLSVKRFAYKYQNENYIMTDVWKVQRGKKNQPREWKDIKFFSTHKRIENRKELVFVNKKPNAYFRYKNLNGAGSHKGHDVTLTHELCVEILSEISIMTFKIGNDSYKIYVSDCEIEYKIETENAVYYADLFLKFNKSEPEWLVTKWNGIVVVEVYVTHKTEDIKRKDLFDIGIPIIEIDVSKKFYIDETREISEEEINEKKEFISKYYKKEIFAKLIANPSSKEYSTMIDELKKQLLILQKQNIEQNSEIQQKNKMINKLQLDCKNLNNLINHKNNELSIIRQQNEKLKKTFWYKLFKKSYSKNE